MSTFQIVGIIIGGLIAYFVYNDAQKRGMNAVVWAIVGFLFGLIGVIIYLIARKPVVEGGPSVNNDDILDTDI